MRLLATAVSALLITGCATERGNMRHAQHAKDQIEMVRVQREAMVREVQADAQTNAQLVAALTEISRANPSHAPAAIVALAVLGVSGQGEGAGRGNGSAPMVTLQQQRNDALEWAKVVSPVAGSLINGLGVAAIQASVTKRQAEISRDIQINDAEMDAKIVESVAGLGVAAVGAGGIDVGGDYYAVQDEAIIDQSTTNTTTTTTTTTNTETNTTTTSGDTNSDAYNTSGDTNSDAYNTSGDTIDDDSLNSSYITSLGAMNDGQIADIVLNGGAVDIYTAGGVVTVTDDNLCDLFPDLTACAP